MCLVNDPRPKHSYNKLYTVEYLGNMTGGQPVLYINQPIDVLKKATIASLKDNEVGRHFLLGMSLDTFDYCRSGYFRYNFFLITINS